MAKINFFELAYKDKKEDKNNIIYKDNDGNICYIVHQYINKDNKPCAMIFRKKAYKPCIKYYFENAQKRDLFINNYINDRLNIINKQNDEQKQIKKRLKEYKSNIKIGDIFCYRFGYNMTINNFYQVKSIKNKKITLQEIQKQFKQDSFLQGEVKPILNSFIGDEFTKILQVKLYKLDGQIQEYISMGKYYGHAYKTDKDTWHYENHMD